MNISLDSALGRQRRLNQVGETINSIATPAAAYSLRSLTGGDPLAVRVRRDTGGGAGDDDEQDFTVSEINSGALVAFVGSGNNGFVETWYDQSGNDNHVTNTNTGNQPKIVSSGSLLTQGGKACINFDGTDNFLNKETYTQGALSQPNTAFAVAKLDVYTDSNKKIFDGDVATARNMLNLNPAGNGQFSIFAGTVRTTGEDADADRHLLTALYNGASSILRIDTTQKISNNAGTNTMNGIVIGANHDTAQNFWDGDIQEIIICDSNQTSNFTALEGNINSYYSIF
jgi:hypothetical protein|tara:strand:+ start:1204 stop:2058 length:855 start_codon:yes stop_codon:yes gene_type:complete